MKYFWDEIDIEFYAKMFFLSELCILNSSMQSIEEIGFVI